MPNESPLYSMEQFETDMANLRPRFFDTYILPAFVMYYAYKSKGMKRSARRILFIGGAYMALRNYNEYKRMLFTLKSLSQGSANV